MHYAVFRRGTFGQTVVIAEDAVLRLLPIGSCHVLGCGCGSTRRFFAVHAIFLARISVDGIGRCIFSRSFATTASHIEGRCRTVRRRDTASNGGRPGRAESLDGYRVAITVTVIAGRRGIGRVSVGLYVQRTKGDALFLCSYLAFVIGGPTTDTIGARI